MNSFVAILLTVVAVADGDSVRAAWERGGRAKALAWFAENQFGVTPLGRPADERIEARRIVFPSSGLSIDVTCVLPSGADERHPAPVFLFGDHKREDAPPYRKLDYAGIPTNDIVARGYAYVRWNFNDVAPNTACFLADRERWATGIIAYAATGRADATNIVRAADGWGTIGAWAWGHSRVMDWIETHPELDAKRVAVVGHSRGGKTALWAVAQDGRFAMAVANGSGCGGAGLARARDAKAESFGDILKNYGHWFCPNLARWIGRDAEIPHDADDLLRLVAPRLLYVSSGSTDVWAGPASEKAAWDAAHDLWRAYGCEERMGYHCHDGPHKLRADDWLRFMDFADRFLISFEENRKIGKRSQ